MAVFKQVTKDNHLPGTGNDRFSVEGKVFNTLVRKLNTIFTSATEFIYDTISVNTIKEKTSGNNITISNNVDFDAHVNHSSETLTADPGQAQGAINITKTVAFVACSNNFDAVTLPVADGARLCVVHNTSSSNVLDVYPASGDDLGEGVNQSTAVEPDGVAVFRSHNGTADTWRIEDFTWPHLTTTTGITAFSGGGQGSAIVLTTKLNIVSTVAADGDSVKLSPDVVPGVEYIIVNADTGQKLSVYPPSGGNLGFGTNNPITVPPQDSVRFISTGSGSSTYQYISEEIVEVTTGITAFAGGGQGSAVELNGGFSKVGTVATAGDSVKFKSNQPSGVQFIVKNGDAADAMDLFPPSGGDLGAGANTAVSVAANTTVRYISTGSNTFESIT